MATSTVKKAVFPVAGLGTRFLPATKANPKEMLPIVDKPLIQYAVEEAIAAGITELIFVTSISKRAIEDHFDCNYELESKLEERGKVRLLSIVREIIPRGVVCVYIRQPNPLGLGHAVLCAKNVVGNEPFAVLLADDLIDCSPTYCLVEMKKRYDQTQSSVIAAQQVLPSETEKYGIIDLQEGTDCIKNIIEKPRAEEAPSTLAAVGRYILTPRVFELLETIDAGAGGEIQLTDGISRLLKEETVYAHQFKGIRYDCGTKLGYLQATVAHAFKHPEVSAEFKRYLKDLLNESAEITL
ncbi:MAG: UTP--glucose-1-phosphate uridylyltransferase GalU [Gammaproteobacteria bacterium]|nr:UTP--glucose-1-phosphate uridylyltransferase GalU [Gammaproteobacteria bacterium]